MVTNLEPIDPATGKPVATKAWTGTASICYPDPDGGKLSYGNYAYKDPGGQWVYAPFKAYQPAKKAVPPPIAEWWSEPSEQDKASFMPAGSQKEATLALLEKHYQDKLLGSWDKQWLKDLQAQMAGHHTQIQYLHYELHLLNIASKALAEQLAATSKPASQQAAPKKRSWLVRLALFIRECIPWCGSGVVGGGL